MKKLHWRKWIAGLLLVSTVWTQCFSYALATDISDMNTGNESVEEVNSNIDESVIESSSEEEANDAESSEAESNEAESGEAESSEAESSEAESSEAESSQVESSEAESSEAESSQVESSEAESSEAESSEAESNEVESERNEAVETGEDGDTEGVTGEGSEGLTEDGTEGEANNEGVDNEDEVLDFIPLLSPFALVGESNYYDLSYWSESLISATGDKIVVYNTEGLIALSHTNPSQYYDRPIELTLREDSHFERFDLRGTVEVDGTVLSYMGLGSEYYPYMKQFSYASNAERQSGWVMNRPIFNVLDSSAILPEIIINSQINTNNPVLAETVIDLEEQISVGAENDWQITINGGTIGGIIGELQSGIAKLTVSLNSDTNCNSGGNAGLFCRVMGENTTLTTNLLNESNKRIAITGNNDVGGLVGVMNRGARLKASALLPSVIQSNQGNAGGVVGYVKGGAQIELASEAQSIRLYNSKISSGNDCGAGGIAGKYHYDGTNGIDWSRFIWKSDANTDHNNQGLYVGGPGYAGGAVGILECEENYTMNATAPTTKINIYSNSYYAKNYGGIVGTYKPLGTSIEGKRGILLNMSNFYVVASVPSNTSFGGIIGELPSTAYVEMQDNDININSCQASCFGGLVGKIGKDEPAFLNVGSYKVKGNINSGTYGGTVGELTAGIVRLHGEIDLSELVFSSAGTDKGQIVGKNGNGLVYALGTGNEGSGWSLKRYSGATASDIGNWGEVIRLDGNSLCEVIDETSESDSCVQGNSTTLFVFNTKRHTVTIQGSPANTYEIKSVRDFAAYALAFDYAKDRSCDIPNLLFGGDSVSTNETQAISISTSVNLRGTGILGIGRDIAELNDSSKIPFQGTISGSNSSVTVTVEDGCPSYGTDYSNSKLCIATSAHDAVALIPNAKDTTVSNLKIAGNLQGYSANNNDTKVMASVIGVGAGSITFNQVEVSTTINITGSGDNYHVGGFLGRYIVGDNLTAYTIDFSNQCKWTSEASISSTCGGTIAGFVGSISGNKSIETAITVDNCSIQGSLTAGESVTAGLKIGGLVAIIDTLSYSDAVDNKKKNTVALSNLMVEGCGITAANLTDGCGGFLGCSWLFTDVVFNAEGGENFGIKVTQSSLTAPKSVFGGLVYEAFGYWNATKPNSILFEKDGEQKNVIKGKTTAGKPTDTEKDISNSPSGLLVAVGMKRIIVGSSNKYIGIYLELGTCGNALSAAYKATDAIDLTLTSDSGMLYFDEIVGKTIREGKLLGGGHYNGVVSIATENNEKIDQEKCNTYSAQLSEKYKNPNTRYYYNLNSYRLKGTNYTRDGIDSAEELLLWSLYRQSTTNISNLFPGSTDSSIGYVTIKNDINLNGYSYYPFIPNKAVVIGSDNKDNINSLTFNYENMNGFESSNKSFGNEESQHYLMQCGLFADVKYDITVQNMALSGTVGLVENSSLGITSGAIMLGKIEGDMSKNPAVIRSIIINNVTLNGLRVSGVDGTDKYAPLLINCIGEGINLTVSDLVTGTGYVKGDNTQYYAASSLFGKVGEKDATGIKLKFANISLDSRRNGVDTYVMNNNASRVQYNTYHTIFTRATLLDSFQYSSGCSGSYNFNISDTKVTYGKEISNLETGRNLGNQFWYNDEHTKYVWDGLKDDPNTLPDKKYFNTGYLRYVYRQEGYTYTDKENQVVDDNYKELDINLKVAHLTKGCGTYGDPYQISSADEWLAVVDFINNGSTTTSWGVRINKDTYNNAKQTDKGYHTESSRPKDADIIYYCDGESFYENIENTKLVDSITVDGMRAYLRNAYYQITQDIEISTKGYRGIGGKDTQKTAFSGVIVGENLGDESNPRYPTVTITMQDNDIKNFGGLICYSQGSVVKNLTVSYPKTEEVDGKQKQGAKLVLSNGSKLSETNTPFFGGIVGYCIGGDTVLDNVSVLYGEDTVSPKGGSSTERFIAIGGYVGLVGGFWTSAGELAGGGVVFRNMKGRQNPFIDSNTENRSTMEIISEAASSYFYCNPFVGRVLDGYACYDSNVDSSSKDNWTLDNTDKNYTIPDLHPYQESQKDLVINSDWNIQAQTSQGLWLLSSIINSGAGAMDGEGKYSQYANDKLKSEIDAYYFGKTRNAKCSYNYVGAAMSNDTKAIELSDEKWWGGIGYSAEDRVSYLINGFTDSGTQGYASKISGKSSANESSANERNNVVTLSLGTATNSEIDMQLYANGFRGIGASYGYEIKIWQESDEDSWKSMWRRNLFVKSISGIADSYTTVKLKREPMLYDKEDLFCRGLGLFVSLLCDKECQITNLKLTGVVKAHHFQRDMDLEIKEITDAQRNVTSVYSSGGAFPDFCVGALAGRTIYSGLETTTNVQLSNVHLDHITVSGGHQTGGFIGCVDLLGGTKNVTFDSWSIQGLTMDSKLDSDGCIGGLVGWYYGKASLTINKNLEITTPALSNLSLTSNKTTYLGGLVGSYNNGTVKITDVTLKSINMYGEKADSVGGYVGRVDSVLEMNGCRLESSQVSGEGCNDIGGFLGKTNVASAKINILDCQLKDVQIICPNSNCSGGVAGKTMGVTVIKNVTLNNVSVLSKQYTGGAVGKTDDWNGNIYLADMVLQQCIVAVPKGNNVNSNVGAGSLIGHNTSKVNGYNILLDTAIIGYYQTVEGQIVLSASNIGYWKNDRTFTTYESAKTSNDAFNSENKIGRFIGYNQSGDSNLIAVACKENCYIPMVDVTSNSAKVVYADYLIDQTSMPNTAKAPWLDCNPVNSDIVVKENSSETGLILSGNGATMVTEGVNAGKSLPEVIWSESQNNSSVFRQYARTAELTNETQGESLLNSEAEVYLSTYKTEEGMIPGKSNADFPVLVINSEKQETIENAIWRLVGVLTNVSSATEAKNNASRIQISTYRFTTNLQDGNAFLKQAQASLEYDGNTKSITSNGNYDNQLSQFTLLDVVYSCLAPGNTVREYHLYIPILMKKVLHAKVTLKLLEGTNYNSADYYKGSNNGVTASFGNNFTALLEYNYEKTREEWQASINAGENLLWSYQKKISLSDLPVGTKLTLVDRQSMKVYTYEFTAETRQADKQNLVQANLKALLGVSDNDWVDVPICDLLDIKAEPNEAGMYVKISSDANEAELALATVRVRNSDAPGQFDYYRLKTAEDDQTQLYTLTIGTEVVGDDKYLKRGEAYYLTVCVPQGVKDDSAKDIVVINNAIKYPDKILNKVEGTKAPPTVLQVENVVKRYVIYDFIAPTTLKTQTNRVNGLNNHNGESGTDMESGDSIKIELDTTVSLQSRSYQDNGEERNTLDLFKNYKPQTLYQQYVVSLKDYKPDSVKGEDVPIFADGVTVDYYIYYDSTNPYEGSNTESYESVTTTELPKNEQGQTVYQKKFKVATQILETEEYYGVSELVLQPVLLPRNDLEYNHSLKVKAVITLQYNDVEQQKFPTSGGIGVCSKSRVSTDKNTLPIGIIAKADDGDRYYTKVVSRAKLSVNLRESQEAVEKGDSNIQLGINYGDTLYNPVDEKLSLTTVNAIARYDYSQLDAGVLSGENKKLMFTLSLYQKQDDGTYDTSKPLVLTDYLKDIKVIEEAMTETGNLENGKKTQPSYSEGGKKLNIICSFTPTLNASPSEESQEKIYSLPFDFSVITGKEFEKAGHIYANYKVIVEAYIVDEVGTNAEDSLVYTNARVMTHMLKN